MKKIINESIIELATGLVLVSFFMDARDPHDAVSIVAQR